MTVIGVVKDLDSLSLILVADFDAPMERVWQLWADPRKLERWWGPPTHPATLGKHDLAAARAVAYFMTGPEGEKSRGWWRVLSVNPARSLEFSDGFANQDGTPNGAMATTAVQMQLTERGGGTRMELRFAFESGEHMEQLERWGAFEVFPQSVGQMDALLATGQLSPGGPLCARSSRISSFPSMASSSRPTSGTSGTPTTRWEPRSAPASSPPTPC